MVLRGFSFEGYEVTAEPANPALGKWYKDRDNCYYWGGGLIVEAHLPGPRVSYANLPANLPADFRFGIDLSHHNDRPDWQAFKDAGVSFAYCKISEGVGMHDHLASAHALNAVTHGIRPGYYHFCRPDLRNDGPIDAAAEAIEALSLMTNLPATELPLVLDLEDQANWDTPLNHMQYVQWIRAFVDTVREKTGKDCMLYSRRGYFDDKLPADHGLGNIRFWLSAYPTHPDAMATRCPKGWSDWAIWQYTESGAIGPNRPLDLNIMKDASLF